MRQIINLTNPLKTPLRVKYCQSFLCRLMGLTFRRKLAADEGLLLVQKRENRTDASIHMLFVWMDLAVIWINQQLEVVDVKLARSWHLMYFPESPAQYVLEIAPERLGEFQIGDQLVFDEEILD